MPARDLATQFSGTIPAGGIRVDMGRVDFSSGSATLEVPTTLHSCRMGFGIADLKVSGNQILVATTDGDVSNGLITFRREGPFISEDATFNIVMFGI